jgi:phage-related holin
MVKDLINVFNTSVAFKTFAGIVLTVFGFFFDALLAKIFLIIIVLTLIDCGLGYIRAFKEKSHVTSRVMKRYMWKFSGYMIATSSLYLMSNAMPAEVQLFTGWLDNFALAFFAIHEAISIIEHLNELEVPLPTNLLSNLRKVKGLTDPDETDKFQIKKSTTDEA